MPSAAPSCPGRREECREDVSGALPLPALAFELGAAGAGQLVDLRLAVVVGDAPLTVDRALLLELEQGGVEGAVVDGEAIAGDFLDPAGDAVAVEWTHALKG